MKKIYYKKIFELLIATFFPPFIIIFFNIQKLVLPIVILTAILTFIYLSKKNYKFGNFLKTKKRDLKKISLRVISVCIILFFLNYFISPEILLIFPYLDFKLWIVIMILYPVFSAFPQELIFRVFFFERYSVILKNKNLLIFINAFVFAIMHCIYLNFIIVILAFCGGIIFASNYYYNKSVFLVTLEHALIGNFMFSIGLGHYFFQGNIKYIYSLI